MWNPFRRKLIPFADDPNMERLSALADDFYRKVLEGGDEPAFVSDEATVFDFSSSEAEYLIQRIAEVYGKAVTASDLRQSFWVLLSRLNDLQVDPVSPTTDSEI